MSQYDYTCLETTEMTIRFVSSCRVLLSCLCSNPHYSDDDFPLVSKLYYSHYIAEEQDGITPERQIRILKRMRYELSYLKGDYYWFSRNDIYFNSHEEADEVANALIPGCFDNGYSECFLKFNKKVKHIMEKFAYHSFFHFYEQSIFQAIIGKIDSVLADNLISNKYPVVFHFLKNWFDNLYEEYSINGKADEIYLDFYGFAERE